MKKFIEKIGQYKLLDLLKIITRRLLKTYCYKMHYLALDIDIDDIRQRLSVIDLPVRELQYEDFLHGNPSFFTSSKLEGVKQRLTDGQHKAYGIIDDDKLIYSTWIGLEQLSLPVKSNHKLAKNEGLLEDSYCDVSARGKGLHYQMNIFRVNELYKFGKNRVIAIVMSGNQPAFKVQYKTGFHECGTFYCGEIFGIAFSTLNKSKYENR